MSGKNMMRYARMLLCIMLLAALLSGRTGAAKADGPAGAAGRSNEGGGASLSGRSLPDPVIVEVPEAKTDLAAFSYDNKDIELVTAGVAEGGTFYYALGTDAVTVPDSSLFSPDIPTPQEDTFPVGVHYVWYKVIGDEFHQNTDPEVVPVIVPPLIACKNYKTDVLDLKGYAASLPEGVKYDKTMFFYLPKEIANGDTMLTVRGEQSGEPTDLRGITFGVAALFDVNLKKGDTVNLIYNKNGLITDEGLSTVASSELADASFLAPHNRAVDMKYELSISKKDNTTIICTVDDIIVNPDPNPEPEPNPEPGPNPDPEPDPVLVPASAPVFDPEDGIFTGDSLDVKITCATQGAEIHYTMAEGTNVPTDPSFATDTYGEPITIRETTTIKAVAIAQGFSNSAVVTKTYTKQAAPQLIVSVSATPADGGTISGGGTYDMGTKVTVTATPNPGYRFVNWIEGETVVSTDAAYTFMVLEERTLTANFEELPPFDKEHVNFIIPAGHIGANAFADDEAIAIVDTSHCASIGDSAFSGCTGLTQILLPADCAFPASAFEDCEALVAIYAPGGGTTQEWAEKAGIPFMPVE